MNDPVARMLLEQLGDELRAEVGEGIVFAALVDWRDGNPVSYVSNGDRADVADAFDEWLQRTAPAAIVSSLPGHVHGDASPELEAIAARVGKQFGEEDCGIVLFLFNSGPDKFAAWYTNKPRMRELLETWVTYARRPLS